MGYPVFRHIIENAKEKGIYIDFINGYTDHVHCLVSLGSGMGLGEMKIYFFSWFYP